MRKRTVLQSILLALLIIAALLCIMYLWFVNSYNKRAQERRQPISEPEIYSELEYIRPAYENFKDDIAIYKIYNDHWKIDDIAFYIAISGDADKDRWSEIVSGFAENINNSDRPIQISFYSGDYFQGKDPAIYISNYRYINERGETPISDGENFGYVHFALNSGEYDPTDMIAALDPDYILFDSLSFIENDRQAFIETLQKTDTQRIIISCHFNNSDDEEEQIEEYRQNLQELMPDIEVFCK